MPSISMTERPRLRLYLTEFSSRFEKTRFIKLGLELSVCCQETDFGLLYAGIVAIQNEFQAKHEGENEEAKKNSCEKLGAPNSEGDSKNHDQGAQRCQRTEKNDAGGAAKVDRGNEAKGQVSED